MYERKILKRSDRRIETVPTEKILEELRRQLFEHDLSHENFEIVETIKWKKPELRGIPREDQRKRYLDLILQILSFRRLSGEIKEYEEYPYNCLRIKLPYTPLYFEKVKRIEDILKHSMLLIFEDSIHYASFLNLQVKGRVERKEEIIADVCCVSEKYERMPEKFIKKVPYSEFFTINDIELLTEYYTTIERFIFYQVVNRGLTIRCAVGKGEGYIRRKDKHGKGLIVRRKGDLANIIKEYGGVEIISDLNKWGSRFVEEIVIDLDPGQITSFHQLTIFAQDIFNLLDSFNFRFLLRFTGGKGLHFVLKGDFKKMPSWYPLYDRGLKYETLEERVGEFGLISRALADFGKLLALAAAYERKMIEGQEYKISIEKENRAHRYYCILADIHSFANKGVRAIGSLHYKTGKVCIPLKNVPARTNLKKIIESSFMPEIDLLEEFPERYKSKWIYTILKTPQLLIEPDVYDEMIIEKINRFFEKYGFLAEKYPSLPEERNRFYKTYIW
jgi:hypothetical protein